MTWMMRGGLACVLLSAATAAGAQERDTVPLERIVVTATRFPTSLDRVSAAVTILHGGALRAAGIRSVGDALRQVPGANVVQTGSFGGTTSLFLRGGESDYVRVLINGVPINRPGGSFDFAGLTTDDVERIEIVRGPGGVLYGSDAMTGVINIITREEMGTFEASAGVRAGTYESWGAGAGVAGATHLGAMAYSVSLSRFGSGGLYPINNGYANAVASGSFRMQPDIRTDARLTLRYTDGEFHFPTDGSGRIADANQRQTELASLVSLDAGRRITERVEARVLLAVHRVNGRSDDLPDQLDPFEFRSHEVVNRKSADARLNLRLFGETMLTVGAVAEDERERTGNTFSAETLITRSSWAAYGQVVVELGRLGLDAGARREDNAAFGGFATYRLGASYRLASGTRVRATIATGFKEPTFFENYATGFVTGNPDLNPERSRSWEVGVERSLLGSRLTLAATYFDQRFRDLIEFTFSPPAPGDPNYFNVAGGVARGVELGADAVLAGLSLSAHYTWLHTEAVDTALDGGPDGQFALGQRLLRRPTHSGGLTLGSRWDVVRAQASLSYVGDRAELDFAGFPATRVVLPAYTRVDLGVEVEVIRPSAGAQGPAFTGTLRVENVFDRRYEEALHFPARGRVVFVGGRVDFGM
jgi:vitamin B12 transporter